jgi:hypothetical protein
MYQEEAEGATRGAHATTLQRATDPSYSRQRTLCRARNGLKIATLAALGGAALPICSPFKFVQVAPHIINQRPHQFPPDWCAVASDGICRTNSVAVTKLNVCIWHGKAVQPTREPEAHGVTTEHACSCPVTDSRHGRESSTAMGVLELPKVGSLWSELTGPL